MYISAKNIQLALNHYESRGYKLIDVPLVVDSESSEHTKPKGVRDLSHIDNKVYVASAEQSFIQLHKEGKLPDGKYCAITPCYRPERTLDETRYLVFLKVELIVVGLYKMNPLMEMINDAKKFFNSILGDLPVEVGNLILDNEVDLIYNGIELGSYGYRKMLGGTQYYYGTGCAEPRLSVASNLKLKTRGNL